MPEAGVLAAIDPANYLRPPASDDRAIVFPPDPGHDLSHRRSVDRRAHPPGMQLRKEFTVKPVRRLTWGISRSRSPAMRGEDNAAMKSTT